MDPTRPDPRSPSARSAFPVGLACGLLVLVAVALPIGAAAQHVESPVIPRGTILFEIRSSHVQASSLFGEGGEREAFGAALFDAPFTAGTFPALESEEERFRALLEDPGAQLRPGALAGRFDADEQHTPLRVGWGATDRITLGLTVPVVRRQRSALFAVDPSGANAGMNPSQGSSASEVSAFRASADGALTELETSVETLCTDEGDEAPGCQAGRATVDRVQSFLGQLDAAWDEALLFPLAGSAAGDALAARWAGLRSELAEWEAGGPDSIPLAMDPLSTEAFRSEFGVAIWGAGGFPFDGTDPLVELGDVRVHLAAALLTGRERDESARLRIRSAIELTAQFPTGVADSLGLVYPMDPAHGYGGGGIRWLTDVLLDDRLALLAELEWRTYLDRELVLIGTNPAHPWSPDTARQEVSGAPGDRLRIRLAPRWSLAPGLSIGAGWELLQNGESRWIPTGGTDPDAVVRSGGQRQRASVELRFAGWDDRFAGQLPFPVEILARGSWSVTGSGGAPRDRRFEVGARVLRGAR